jgi:hypothetical protein
MEGLSEFTLIILDIMSCDLSTIVPKPPTATVEVKLCSCSVDDKAQQPPQQQQQPQQQPPGGSQANQTSATAALVCPVWRVKGHPSECDRYYAVVMYPVPLPSNCPWAEAGGDYAPPPQNVSPCFVPIPNPTCVQLAPPPPTISDAKKLLSIGKKPLRRADFQHHPQMLELFNAFHTDTLTPEMLNSMEAQPQPYVNTAPQRAVMPARTQSGRY